MQTGTMNRLHPTVKPKAQRSFRKITTAFLVWCLLLTAVSAPGIDTPAPFFDEQFKTRLTASLNDEEKQWLKDHETIRIAGPRAFPPFFFYDDELQPQGMGADYSDLILGTLGIKVDIRRDLPWPQVMQQAQAKEIDLISLAGKTTERESFLLFPQAYLSFPLVIITRQDAPFISGLQDLHNKKITCIKSNITCTWLVRDGVVFEPVWVDTPLHALEAVAFSSADIHIENLAAASFHIRQHNLANLKIAAPTDYGDYELYFAIRKDWPELVSIVNKALTMITPAQHSAIRNKWLSIRYEHGIRKSDLVKWLALICGILLLPLIVFLIWNRRLKSEVAKRTRMGETLQETQERYSALFERSLDPIVIYDHQGNLIDANPVACRVMQLSKATIKGKSFAAFLDKQQLTALLDQAQQILTFGYQKQLQEIKLTRPDGEVIWLETIGSLVLQNGKPFAIQGLGRDITERKKAEKAQKSLIRQLLDALENIKTLKGLLPICANCKKIRDDSGYWNQIESYIEKHSDALFSHGICPDCAFKLYGNEPWYKKQTGE